VDIARGGNDKTAIVERHGTWFGRIHKYAGSMTPDGPSVVALFVPLLRDGAKANLDVIGVGTSVYDTAIGQGLSVAGINFGAGSHEYDKSGSLAFSNLRAEFYWRLREALEPINPDNPRDANRKPIALPPDSELLGDLRALRWKMAASGIQIESKDAVKKRIGRSPDCGDAVALALYQEGPAIYAVGVGG